MNDTSKEVAFVDSLSTFIIRSKAKSTSQEASDALPLNRSQYIKFLKYMNTAAQSEGQLLFVFVDQASGKIIDFNGNPFPAVETSNTFMSSVYFGEFVEAVAGYDYNQTTKRIEGYSVGYFEVKTNYAGFVIGTKYRLQARMAVTMDNVVSYKVRSSLF